MRTKTRSILVVEDNELIQYTISAQLKRLKYTFEIAPDGASALAMVFETEYPLILMDVHMPGLSGLDTVSRIRQFEEESNLARSTVVGLTIDSAMPHQCIDAGMQTCLLKPISLGKLQELLNRYYKYAEN